MAAVDRVMSSGWFLQGEETRSFEAEICSRNNLLLLEDCAQSHGCQWQGRFAWQCGGT